MSNIDPMLMRQIIMDHYDYPRNKKLTDKDGYMSLIFETVASCSI
jgi:nitrogen fixation protein NifU and related proteins